MDTTSIERPATRSGRRASQDAAELSGLISLLKEREVLRYLEIGARHGDTFWDVMRALPVGSVGVAVDLPGGAWGKKSSRHSLKECVSELQRLGYRVSGIFGDSTALATRRLVDSRGPYDAILIDGDHRYDGVKADWQHYGELAPIIAFHDIVGSEQRDAVGNPVEVPQLWSEIAPLHEHRTFVSPGSKMGIGAILR